MKKILVVFVTIIVCCIVLSGCNATATAFTVNGDKVSEDELVFYMNRYYDAVVAEAEATFALDATAEGFWTEKMGETTPIEMLKSIAKEEIVRVKVLQQTAQKYGISSPMTYSEQLSEWKRDNADRKKREAAGEIIYGVIERPFYTYLTLVLSEVENKLKGELERDGTITVTEQEMKTYYSAHSDWFSGEDNTFEENKQSIYTWVFNEEYEAYLSSLIEECKIEYIDMSVNETALD